VKEKEGELRDVLTKENLHTLGALQVARFDPPWKPGFMRHNEVILQIEYP
jgi:SOUL heme-binding protein